MTSNSRASVQSGLDNFEEGYNKNIIRFGKEKWKDLHLHQNDPKYQHKMGRIQQTNSPAEKGLVITMISKVKYEPLNVFTCTAYWATEKHNQHIQVSFLALPNTGEIAH